MTEKQTINVQSGSDIITARMKVRQLARARGFGITEQARISLAASSLASSLGLGTKNPGQIIVDCLNQENAIGLRVICIAFNRGDCNHAAEELKSAGWMVDELTVETLPSNDVQITAIQWMTRRGAWART